MSKKLRDVLPYEAVRGEYDGERFQRYLDVEVVEEVHMHGADMPRWRPWPGQHKNVLNWWKLANGYAVGWNENMARGWSFPVVKLP